MQATLNTAPLWVQFWHLTKPRVVSLIVFTAVIGMLLAAPTLPAAGLLVDGDARHRAGGGRRRRLQLPGRAEDRRRDGAHARRGRRSWARITHGADPAHVGRGGRPGPRDPVARREPAHHVAHARHLRGLRDHLHRDPQARHAAEHRDRRRLRARCRRVLGWAAVTGDVHLPAAAALPHHLRVDAAAFLGAGALPPPRVRARRRADAAGHARRGLHARCTCCSTRCCWWRRRCCRSRPGSRGSRCR